MSEELTSHRTTPEEAAVDRGTMLEDLRVIRRLVNWAVGVGSAAFIAWCVVLVSDHFLLARVSGDMADMKPRVEKLWWTSPYSK